MGLSTFTLLILGPLVLAQMGFANVYTHGSTFREVSDYFPRPAPSFGLRPRAVRPENRWGYRQFNVKARNNQDEGAKPFEVLEAVPNLVVDAIPEAVAELVEEEIADAEPEPEVAEVEAVEEATQTESEEQPESEGGFKFPLEFAAPKPSFNFTNPFTNLGNANSFPNVQFDDIGKNFPKGNEAFNFSQKMPSAANFNLTEQISSTFPQLSMPNQNQPSINFSHSLGQKLPSLQVPENMKMFMEMTTPKFNYSQFPSLQFSTPKPHQFNFSNPFKGSELSSFGKFPMENLNVSTLNMSNPFPGQQGNPAYDPQSQMSNWLGQMGSPANKSTQADFNFIPEGLMNVRFPNFNNSHYQFPENSKQPAFNFSSLELSTLKPPFGQQGDFYPQLNEWFKAASKSPEDEKANSSESSPFGFNFGQQPNFQGSFKLSTPKPAIKFSNFDPFKYTLPSLDLSTVKPSFDISEFQKFAQAQQVSTPKAPSFNFSSLNEPGHYYPHNWFQGGDDDKKENETTSNVNPNFQFQPQNFPNLQEMMSTPKIPSFNFTFISTPKVPTFNFTFDDFQAWLKERQEQVKETGTTGAPNLSFNKMPLEWSTPKFPEFNLGLMSTPKFPEFNLELMSTPKPPQFNFSAMQPTAPAWFERVDSNITIEQPEMKPFEFPEEFQQYPGTGNWFKVPDGEESENKPFNFGQSQFPQFPYQAPKPVENYQSPYAMPQTNPFATFQPWQKLQNQPVEQPSFMNIPDFAGFNQGGNMGFPENFYGQVEPEPVEPTVEAVEAVDEVAPEPSETTPEKAEESDSAKNSTKSMLGKPAPQFQQLPVQQPYRQSQPGFRPFTGAMPVSYMMQQPIFTRSHQNAADMFRSDASRFPSVVDRANNFFPGSSPFAFGGGRPMGPSFMLNYMGVGPSSRPQRTSSFMDFGYGFLGPMAQQQISPNVDMPTLASSPDYPTRPGMESIRDPRPGFWSSGRKPQSVRRSPATSWYSPVDSGYGQ